MRYRIKRVNQEYTVWAGAVHGVTTGAAFKVYKKGDTGGGTFVLATTPVAHVRSVESTLELEGDSAERLAAHDADEIFALQETVGEFIPLLLYIDEQVNGPVSQALDMLQQERRDFYFDRTTEEPDATFKVTSQHGLLSFYHVDNPSGTRFPNPFASKLPHVLPANLDHAKRVLMKAAHFYYFLNLEGEQVAVGIQLGEVLEPQGWDHARLGRNLFESGKVVIHADESSKAKVYGLRITNPTKSGLYVSLFHFHGGRLDIST